MLSGEGTKNKIMKMTAFHSIACTFRSVKVAAAVLLWISSNLGCLQLPVGALAGIVVGVDWEFGVEGIGRVAMAVVKCKRITM